MGGREGCGSVVGWWGGGGRRDAGGYDDERRWLGGSGRVRPHPIIIEADAMVEHIFCILLHSRELLLKRREASPNGVADEEVDVRDPIDNIPLRGTIPSPTETPQLDRLDTHEPNAQNEREGAQDSEGVSCGVTLDH